MDTFFIDFQDHSILRDKTVTSDSQYSVSNVQCLRYKATMHEVEGFALVLLCGCKPITIVRKLAGLILKEVRNLFTVLKIPKVREFNDTCQNNLKN